MKLVPTPLEGMNGSKLLNRRLQSWMLKLMDFSFTVVYSPGAKNGAADGLSRQALLPRQDERSGTPEGGCEVRLGGCGNPTPLKKEKEKIT